MDAKTVALKGYRGLMSGKTLVIPGLRNWLLTESLRVSPRKVVTAVSRRLMDEVGSGRLASVVGSMFLVHIIMMSLHIRSCIQRAPNVVLAEG